MRSLKKITVVTAVLAGAAAPVAALAPAASAQTSSWQAYHGVSASTQKSRVSSLGRQGYRPITVNVSGSGYAATWVKEGGAGWLLYQGMSSSGYQQRFDQEVKAGYQPVSVSATGAGGSAVFVAIFEKKSGAFRARHNLTSGQFAAENAYAASHGLVLTSVDVYGTPGDPRYVGVWTPNDGGAWYYTAGKTVAQHAAEFKSRVAKGYRPTSVAVGPDGTYTAVWRKDGLRDWANYIDMSSSGYQRRFDQLKAKGLLPVQVNAENGRYAAVFSKG